MDVPSQDVITKDNISVKVNAVVYCRVIEPIKAITEIEDFYFATSQIAQTTLRSILGQSQLDELLSNREQVNAELQMYIFRPFWTHFPSANLHIDAGLSLRC